MAPMSNYQEPLFWLVRYFSWLFFDTLAISTSAQFLISFLGIHPPHWCAAFWLALKFIILPSEDFIQNTNVNMLGFCLSTHQWVLISWKAKLCSVTSLGPSHNFPGHLCPSFYIYNMTIFFQMFCTVLLPTVPHTSSFSKTHTPQVTLTSEFSFPWHPFLTHSSLLSFSSVSWLPHLCSHNQLGISVSVFNYNTGPLAPSTGFHIACLTINNPRTETLFYMRFLKHQHISQYMRLI